MCNEDKSKRACTWRQRFVQIHDASNDLKQMIASFRQPSTMQHILSAAYSESVDEDSAPFQDAKGVLHWMHYLSSASRC